MESINKKKPFIKKCFEWIIYFFVAFAIASFVNSQIFSLAQVQQTSMLDTLSEKDMLCVNKIAYCFSSPKRGDIIVFLKDKSINGFFGKYMITLEDIFMKFSGKSRKNRYIKRIIALPGDKIEIKNKKVYINDKPLEEDYVKGITTNKGFLSAVVVPENSFFVMGDNRFYSVDSRRFGFIDYNNIEGKAFFRLFPLSHFGKIK